MIPLITHLKIYEIISFIGIFSKKIEIIYLYSNIIKIRSLENEVKRKESIIFSKIDSEISMYIIKYSKVLTVSFNKVLFTSLKKQKKINFLLFFFFLMGFCPQICQSKKCREVFV